MAHPFLNICLNQDLQNGGMTRRWPSLGQVVILGTGRDPCGQVTTCPNEWDVYLFMMLPDRKLNRLSGYDYSKDGLYFVTSCILDRACVFGTVIAGEMQLNAYGRIAERQWFWLAEQYPYILLHAFVVMPNHIHGIIQIDLDTAFGTGLDQPAHKVKSLSELMGAYKTTTSKGIRLAGLHDFAWQRSFHDHIIRHDRAYTHIKHYIQNNPAKWQGDLFYQTS